MRQPPSDALQAVVVGTGPGSYTGTRIGIAAAIGLALRSRGIALYPWPSIAALVPREEGRKLAHGYLWISDARRKRFALAGIQDGRVTSAPQLFERNEALEKCRRSIAEGLDLVSSDDDPQALALALGFEASTVLGVNPDASLLARQVTALPATELQQLRSMQPSPIYLAAPYVTTARTR